VDGQIAVELDGSQHSNEGEGAQLLRLVTPDRPRLAPPDDPGNPTVNFRGERRSVPRAQNSSKHWQGKWRMKCEKSLPLLVVAIVYVALGTFAQAQTGAQVPRLHLKHTLKPAPSSTRSASSTAGAATPGLPLWTFNVQSNRDGNEYTGSDGGYESF
jgi:hypothetical protein